MVNIFQHVQYCEGRGYVNKGSLAEAMTQEKSGNRIKRDATALLTRGQLVNQNAAAQANQQNTQANALLQSLARPVANVVFVARTAGQRLLQLPQQLGQQLAQTGAQLAQGLQQSPNFLARAVGNLLGFFFSNDKKAKGERNEEAEETRKRDEVSFADPLTFTAIEEPEKSGMGGGK